MYEVNLVYFQVFLDSGEAHITYSPTETSPPILAERIVEMGFPTNVRNVSPNVEVQERISPLLETVIHVDGMTCMSCVNNIESNISKIDGIDSIKVNLDQKKAFVRFNAMKLTNDVIADKINDMGFDAYVASKKSNALIAKIHVDGMTCQNCANNIEAYVKKKDGVDDIRVSLEDKEAFIIYKPELTNPVTLRDIINDMGFEATLPREASVDLEFDKLAKASVSGKEKEVVISIKGMVCMSCVRNIEGNISDKPGIISVKVSLEDENGRVKYDQNITSAEAVAELIDDMGFEAKVQSGQSSALAIPAVPTGGVTVSIKGMTCQSCVKTIEGKISEHPGVKSIKVSLENETGTIVYYPDKVTEQMLVDAIDDMGFDASLKGIVNHCFTIVSLCN